MKKCCVLMVGEYFDGPVHGGIAAVLRTYRSIGEEFRFLPSYRSPRLSDKLRYDAGSLLRLPLILLWNRDIGIVHIHTAAGKSFTKHLLYARVARCMGRKVILHCHASRFQPWYEGLSGGRRGYILGEINKLDRLIVLSESWKAYFCSIGVDSARIAVLNNIVPRPAMARQERKEGAPLRLLFLGEIGPRKGVFDLLKAIKGLEDKVTLDIGGNNMEAELDAAIREGGLEGIVRFHGFVSGEEKQKLLASADVFVLPSYNEGLPISILEAMSYGCAIVSTPVGGIPEVVRENGILVKPGDVAALHDAILSLCEGDSCAVMGARSAEMVKPFYPESVMSKLSEIYSAEICHR